MHEKNVSLLKKIYENSKTAVDALGEIQKHIEVADFNEFIAKQSNKYFFISEEAGVRLKEFNFIPDDVDVLSKLAFDIMINLKKKRTSNYARILIEGCVGGVNEMIGEIRHSENLNSDCIDLANILIETEQETIAILQRFL